MFIDPQGCVGATARAFDRDLVPGGCGRDVELVAKGGHFVAAGKGGKVAEDIDDPGVSHVHCLPRLLTNG